MLSSQIWWQQSNMELVELGDSGTDKHLAQASVNQVGSDQYVEVYRAAEGTAALCGGGEPKQVGDRPRADCGSPVPANVGVVGRVCGDIAAGRFPWERGDDGSLHSGSSDKTRGSTRVRRRFHNGRTIVVGPGCCRDLIHDKVITNITKQRQ
jgi:hypothetical protein